MTNEVMRANMWDSYFQWLYKRVCGDWEPRNLSFRKLLMFLLQSKFHPDNEMDENRAIDGTDLRYRFTRENDG